MKIALFASDRTTIPPEPGTVAASAAVVGKLAAGLVARGDDVTLFAPKGSRSKAKVVDLGLPPSNLDFALSHDEWDSKDSMGMKQMYLSEIYRRADEFDLIHLHTEPLYLGMPLARLSDTPTLFTNHNVFREAQKPIFEFYRDLPLTSISNQQRSLFPDLKYLATVYNGLPIEEYTFNASGGDYLYFTGRLVGVKGVAEAIAAAQTAGKPLQLSGAGTEEFIAQEITPHLESGVTFHGMVPQTDPRNHQLLGEARAALLPIQWEEPFGLVFIEAMALGTPVITFARGAAPEIIEDGVTGFLVNPSDDDRRGDWHITETGSDGIAEAAKRLYELSDKDYRAMRQAARDRVASEFTIDRMVDGYRNVYQQLVT